MNRISTINNKILAILLVSVFAASGVVGALNFIPAVHAATCTQTYSTPPFQQWIISSAGTYCLEAGTYDTQITITASDVTLMGAPGTTASQVVIQPSATTLTQNVLGPLEDPAITWGAGYGEGIIYAYGGSAGISGVTVEGLTVDGSVASADLNTCGGGSLIGNAGWYIGILFSGVTGTITDDTIQNVLQAGSSLYGCQQDATFGIIADMGAGTAPSATVTISQNTITGYAKGGIVCFNPVTATGLTCDVSDNTLSNNVGAYADTNGIQLGPDATGSITGNSVTGNTYSGWNSPGCDLIYNNQGVGILTYGNTAPITISGNSLIGDDVGIFLQSDTGTITTTSNTLSGGTCVGIAVYDESQTVSGNTFSNEPVGIEAVSDTSGLTAVATAIGSTFSNVPTPTTTETANGGSAQATLEQTTFLTCTTSYSASNLPPQQLTVSEPGMYCFAPGTYDTQITVTASDVTLEGTATGAIIQPSASTITPNAVDPDTSAPEAGVITVTGATGVTISNLVIDGSAASSYFAGGAPQFLGVLFLNADGTVTGSTVQNIYPPTSASGSQIGNAIEVQTAAGQTSNVAISNNHAINYDKNGITCNDAGTTCTITGNTVYPYGPYQADTASNGIQIGYGATGTVTSNTVSGNACTDYSLTTPPPSSPYGCGPEEWVSTGILSDGSSGVTISSNTLTGNDIGVYTIDDTGPVTVTSNTISDSTYIGLLVYGESEQVTVTGNSISGTVANPATTCVLVGLETSYATTCGSNLITQYQGDGIYTYENTGPVSLSGNTLTGNDVGMLLQSDTGTVTATSNKISDSTYVGLALYDESQTVSGNTFEGTPSVPMPVGIEVVSDTSGLTATLTGSHNIFTSVTIPILIEEADGGIAQNSYTQTPTTVSVDCASPVAVGTASNCQVSVSGYYPSGSVSFLASGAGSFSSPSCTLNGGSCSVTYTPATTAGSPQTITATYSGDVNNLGNYGTSQITVNPTTPGTSVVCTPGVSGFPLETTASCTVTVTPQTGTPTPTGSVSWTQAGAGSISTPAGSVSFTSSPPSCSLNLNGQCQITITGTGIGSVKLTATYSGDLNNKQSSETVTVTVGKAISTASLSCTSPVALGGSSTCKVSITSLAAGYPAGKVSFMANGAGGFSFPTCKLTGGSCSVTYTPATTAGSPQTITATYSGDTSNLGGYGTSEISVTTPTYQEVMVYCSLATMVVGKATTCKAFVVPAASVPKGGTISWSTTGGGKFSRSTCKLIPDGCTVTYKTSSPGTATITATYSGDQKYGTYVLSVSQSVSKTVLTCNKGTAKVGKTITCTVRVGGYDPTGTVTWIDLSGPGAVSFSTNTCTLNARHSCSVSLVGTTSGEVLIQAAYAGDLNNTASLDVHSLNIK